MGRRVILSDDLTGNESDDVKTHIFMIDNVYYEIDLSADSFAQYERANAPFVKVSRETRRITATSKPEASQAERIRQWAMANGMEVSERGRLSADIIAAYEKANANGSESNSQTDTNPDETDTSESTPEGAEKAPESTPEETEKATSGRTSRQSK